MKREIELLKKLLQAKEAEITEIKEAEAHWHRKVNEKNRVAAELRIAQKEEE